MVAHAKWEFRCSSRPGSYADHQETGPHRLQLWWHRVNRTYTQIKRGLRLIANGNSASAALLYRPAGGPRRVSLRIT